MHRTKRVALASVVIVCLFKFFPVSALVSGSALQFDGINDRIRLGTASDLRVTNFTIEFWFKRNGPGIATTTGGIIAVPLVTKGIREGEGTSNDVNYFVGIDSKTGALAADFEEFGTAVPPVGNAGVNHPLVGTTRICDGVWYHAAATYDSATGAWRLYLNGALEASADLAPGVAPRNDNTQYAGLGAAFTSAGTYSPNTNGAFQGAMDEVRIWDVARSEADIDAGMEADRLGTLSLPQAGLIGRWSFDEHSGTTVADTAGTINGTLGTPALPPGGEPAWVEGSPFESTPRAAGEYGLQMTGVLLGTVVPGTSTGVGDYVTFGQATSTLGATEFTLEAWIKRTGGGRSASTGAGGLTAIPIITKGLDEGDGSDTDVNYFFGIRPDGKLAADFEDASGGLNHPAFGTLTIAPDNSWHHVAVTYQIDAATGIGTWSFYLDGVLDGTTVVGAFTPRSDSKQHAAIGTALNSTGGTGTMMQGFFAGAIDEVRIWKRARTASEIFSGKSRAIRNASGLAGSWSFNECCQVIDSTGQVPDGTLFGSGWTFVAGGTGLPGAVNVAPTVAINTPDQTITLASPSIALDAVVTDPDAILGSHTSEWSASGPAAVTFGDVNQPSTTATFSAIGSYVLTLTGDDGELSASTSVNIQVNEANTAPVANDQAVSTNEDTAAAITLGASDAESATLTYAISGPAHGTLTGTAPNLTYMPAANYSGPDSITFTANDGALDSNVGTVSITVNAQNDAPAANDQNVSATEDTPQAVVLGATDAEGDTLTYIVGSPSHGSLTGTAPNLTYTPEANFHGADTFTFTAKDTSDAVSNLATVQINVAAVNDASAASDQAVSATEDTSQAIVLGATDADNDPLTYTVGSPAHGTLTGTAPNLTYQPDANYHGSDSFTFTAKDPSNAESNVATVSISVGSVNDAPVAAGQAVSATEDTPQAIVLGATDVDGDTLTYTAGSPAHGSLTGTAPNLTYTPHANFHGSDSFTFTAKDPSNAVSNAATVNITVAPGPGTPTAQNQAVTLDEDTRAFIKLNADDPDGNRLRYTVVNGPAHGRLLHHSHLPWVVYFPSANYNGPDSFTFQAMDRENVSNEAVVSLTIAPVNDAPVAHGLRLVTARNTPVSGQLVATDVDGDRVTYRMTEAPERGTVVIDPATGAFTYTPNAGMRSGSDHFHFVANDGTSDSNDAEVHIIIGDRRRWQRRD